MIALLSISQAKGKEYIRLKSIELWMISFLSLPNGYCASCRHRLSISRSGNPRIIHVTIVSNSPILMKELTSIYNQYIL